jgi:hypothetical protein
MLVLLAMLMLLVVPGAAMAAGGDLADGTWTYAGTASFGGTSHSATVKVICRDGRCEAFDIRGWTGSPATFPAIFVKHGQVSMHVPELTSQSCTKRQLDNTITADFTPRTATVSTRLAPSTECGLSSQQWTFNGDLKSFEEPTGFGAKDPSVLSKLPKAGDVNTQAVATAGGAAVVVGSLMVFPAGLLNDSIDELFKRLTERRRSKRGLTAAREIRWWEAASGVMAAGVISGFIDPHFGINAGSARVAVAIVLSFLLEVVLGWALVSWLVRRTTPDASPKFSFQPASLLIVAALVVFTRLTGFQPGIIFGLVAGIGFGDKLGKASTGKVTAIGLAHGYALAIAAWIGYSLLNTSHSVFGAFVSDLLASLTIGGVAAMPLVLLPIGGMAGSKVFEWNRTIWGTFYLLGLFAFFVIVMPMPAEWSDVNLSLGTWLAGYAVYLTVAIVAWRVAHRTPRKKPRSPAKAAH